MSVLLFAFSIYTYTYAHTGVHSSTRLIFSDDEQVLPVVQSNWGFFYRQDDEWKWLCPDVLETTDLYFLEVEKSGTFWFGSLNGLWTSENQCDVSKHAFEGEFVSFIESTDGDLFVSTATGFQENALWLSEDEGETFSNIGTFGEGARIYEFRPSDSGLWVLTVRNLQTYLWWNEEGEDWQSYSISEQVQGWVTLLMTQGDLLWFSSRIEEEYTLWTIDKLGNLRNLLQTEMEIKTGSIIDNTIVVGGDVGHVVSFDNGETWSQRKTNPETACLTSHNGYLYACTHNWLDGAAVMRTQARGELENWIWEPVFSFSDVYSIAECPLTSITTQTCSQRWEAGVLNGGFSEREDTDDTQKETGELQESSNGCSTTNGSGLFYVIVILLQFIRTDVYIRKNRLH